MSWCDKYMKAPDGFAFEGVHVLLDGKEITTISAPIKLKEDTPMKPEERDRLFIQEVINGLVKRHGLRQGDKALDLLIDWSRELRNKSGLKGRTRREFFKRVGKYLW